MHAEFSSLDSQPAGISWHSGPQPCCLFWQRASVKLCLNHLPLHGNLAQRHLCSLFTAAAAVPGNWPEVFDCSAASGPRYRVHSRLLESLLISSFVSDEIMFQQSPNSSADSSASTRKPQCGDAAAANGARDRIVRAEISATFASPPPVRVACLIEPRRIADDGEASPAAS